eukprot:CAMPEP_0184503274 /NCGR_PEP_ID=MMETSP0113_2-20130426/51795_1 /TAXON_ID=91329 /ORGANISM="Norrisiella sphaerica, Strain BC52" /LENGTH=58 /DNA_ID=CAMNT_0026892741 /DNA_START=756 /DNA_END=932 /DNA_ORIENTATION=+
MSGIPANQIHDEVVCHATCGGRERVEQQVTHEEGMHAQMGLMERGEGKSATRKECMQM